MALESSAAGTTPAPEARATRGSFGAQPKAHRRAPETRRMAGTSSN